MGAIIPPPQQQQNQNLRKNKNKKFSSSVLLGILILLTISICGIYCKLILSTFHQNQNQNNHQQQADGLVSSATSTSSKSISCKEVQDNTRKGLWHDPNLGQLFARELIAEPKFRIAVHNRSYDPVRWDWLYEKGKYYEDIVHERFLQILQRADQQQEDDDNSVVLDVGANIGYYSLLSQALGYRVLAFEINPANLIRICESITLNSGPPIQLYQKGVSNLDNIPLQVIVPKNPGQAFMRELNDQKELSKIQSTNATSTHHAFTTTITLDTFAKQMGWLDDASGSSTTTIRLLKLDVEGKEPQIIQGAKQLLHSGKVLNVLTEFRRLLRPTIQEAIETLFDAGYTLVKDDNINDDELQEEGDSTTTKKVPPRRMTREESKAILDELANKYRGKGRNFDFWFQLNT